MRQFFGPRQRKLGCFFSSFLLLFVVVACLYFASTPILTALGSYLEEDDGPRKVDAIVVLGGDRYGDRTLKGAQLAKAGFAPFAYVSGPAKLIGYESTDEVLFAEQHGYPASLFREIHCPAAAESTRTEARFLGQYLAGQGVKSVLLVTSNFHTKRAAKLWRQVNPALHIAIVGSRDAFFAPDRWWKTREGQKTFVYEWMKTVSVMFGI